MNSRFTADYKTDLQPTFGAYIKEEINFCDVPDFVTDIKTEIQEADETFNELGATVKQESVLGSEQYCSRYVPVSNSDLHIQDKDIKIEYEHSTKIDEWNNRKAEQNSEHMDTCWNSKGTKGKHFNSNGQAGRKNEEISKDDYQLDTPRPEDHTSENRLHDDTSTRNTLREKKIKQKNKGKLKFHQCPDCEYKTKYKSGLNRHIICRHKSPDEVEIFKCNFCVYQSSDKFKVKRHLRIHQPEERHFLNCPHCDFRTIHHSALKKHLIRHQNVNDIETYKCVDCDYRTIIRSRLNRHSLRHKKLKDDEMFGCPECSYKAVLKSSLKTHLLRHRSTSEIQMHKCPVCKYETRYKCAMNKHVLIHRNKEVKSPIRSRPVAYSLGAFPSAYFPAACEQWKQE